MSFLERQASGSMQLVSDVSLSYLERQAFGSMLFKASNHIPVADISSLLFLKRMLLVLCQRRPMFVHCHFWNGRPICHVLLISPQDAHFGSLLFFGAQASGSMQEVDDVRSLSFLEQQASG